MITAVITVVITVVILWYLVVATQVHCAFSEYGMSTYGILIISLLTTINACPTLIKLSENAEGELYAWDGLCVSHSSPPAGGRDGQCCTGKVTVITSSPQCFKVTNTGLSLLPFLPNTHRPD